MARLERLLALFTVGVGLYACGWAFVHGPLKLYLNSRPGITVANDAYLRGQFGLWAWDTAVWLFQPIAWAALARRKAVPGWVTLAIQGANFLLTFGCLIYRLITIVSVWIWVVRYETARLVDWYWRLSSLIALYFVIVAVTNFLLALRHRS